MNKQPIGIFDSGIGGTSIWSEISKLMPSENTIYLADSVYAPYGKRTKEEIIALSCKNTEKLIDFDCKIVVVACNTATTNAIKVLREKYSIPFIGIEPAIKPAALLSGTKKIGVLATQGTLSSELFHKTANLYTSDVEMIEVTGTGLVELIEAGAIESKEMLDLLSSYLAPMIEKNIDHLVLGCSHYPYLIPILKNLLPAHVKIIDSGEAVARQTLRILRHNQINNADTSYDPEHLFYTNGNQKTLQETLKNLTKKRQITHLDF